MKVAAKRLVVLISGNGSNLQALMDACAAGVLPAHIVQVIANRKAAYGLTRATQAGIATHYAPLKPYLDSGAGRTAYDLALAAHLNTLQPDLIVLAGWMHIFSAAFLGAVVARVINLHPALPNQFAGANGLAEQFAAYQRGELQVGGCMVHEVIAELDAGQVIGQQLVPFMDGDTLDSFAERLHQAEHQLLVACVGRVLQGQA
jgi:formyltetrahydrofolate-dependent phosphoribosylglycinamide formyltransferase